MATWTVSETADEKFDIEQFFTLNGLVLQNNSDPDIVYYRETGNEATYYVIHAFTNNSPTNLWVSMDFETHKDGGNQSHALLSDIVISPNQFDTLTSTHTGADVASFLFQGDDALTGSSKDDILRGYAGKDSLNGGVGADNMFGGDGDDSYIVDSKTDMVTELADEGTDMVSSYVSYKLGDFVENVTLLNSPDPDVNANLKAVGNGLDNTITGNRANNVLSGLAGVDDLSGGLGNDKLIGGADSDYLTGGKGSDDFVFTAVSDSAEEHDIIRDFQHKHDEIDLSKLHPETKNDQFLFIGNHKFGHHAGELQVVQHDNSGTENDFTMVQGDLDGNGKADLQIEITGLIHLDMHDFKL